VSVYSSFPCRIGDLSKLLRKWCKEGGCLPGEAQLRSTWVPKVFQEHQQALTALFAGQSVSIYADESTDNRDWSIMHIMIGFRNKSYLCEVARLEKADHKVISRKVVECLQQYSVPLDAVAHFVTDNASVCLTAFTVCHCVVPVDPHCDLLQDILHGLLPQAIHVRCLCHILSLVGRDAMEGLGDDCLRLITTWNGLWPSAVSPALHWRLPQGCSQNNLEGSGVYLPTWQPTFPLNK
jgi:hypothetical protein